MGAAGSSIAAKTTWVEGPFIIKCQLFAMIQINTRATVGETSKIGEARNLKGIKKCQEILLRPTVMPDVAMEIWRCVKHGHAETNVWEYFR